MDIIQLTSETLPVTFKPLFDRSAAAVAGEAENRADEKQVKRLVGFDAGLLGNIINSVGAFGVCA